MNNCYSSYFPNRSYWHH